ncbi:LEA type 2 family protein [Paracnuella aquatica]|uniref:LEA type 2 family protein n=1 Tax=Paracnuella aquatica TaxID=2268757 RepID=UPI000DEECD78|nr:LEA type 2 family protein [Paracnuella aquatica]RPD46657.1 hypothetical protein DRJ53_13025 [Paracnuella aquatica]
MQIVRTSLAAVAVTVLLTSCSKVEAPQFRSVGSFKVKKIDFQQVDIGLNVTYYNPNNFGVTVKEAVVDVYLDSVYMGKFTQPEDVAVDKMADFSIPLIGAIPIAKALQLNFRDALNKEVEVKAAGSVRVGKAGVYITRDINYQGRHRVDIKL